MNIHMNTHLEIHFIYLGNKEIYNIFKTCCIILFFPPTKCLWGHPHDRISSSIQLSRSLHFRLHAKPSQAKVLTGGGDLRKAQVDVPLSAIPAFDRKAGLNNRQLNSNRGISLS